VGHHVIEGGARAPLAQKAPVGKIKEGVGAQHQGILKKGGQARKEEWGWGGGWGGGVGGGGDLGCVVGGMWVVGVCRGGGRVLF